MTGIFQLEGWVSGFWSGEMLPELQDLPTPGGDTKETNHLRQAVLVVEDLVERSGLLEPVNLDEVHGAVLEHHDHLRRGVVHCTDHTEVSPLQTKADSPSARDEIVCEKVFLTTPPWFAMFVLVRLV